jgi:AcrR family transcriptional regulator
MLLHYFGSKDRLLAAAMQEFATRQRQLVLEELTRHPVRDPHHHVMAFWRSFASKEREPFLLLLLEMWVAALRDPKRLGVFFEATRGYFDLTVQMLFDSGLPRAQATVSATVYLAALRGLMLDLLATGDRTRIEAAAARIAALIDADVAANQQAGAERPPSRS